MDALTEKPRLRSLLDHFSTVTDLRHPWRVAHPLPEVLLLVVCATIASNDDYDDMVNWGETHLSFLRRFSEFHFGIPCADWLRTLMNRIDPDLFSACFMAWVRDWWPETPDLIALDGKAVTAQSRPQSGPKGTPFRLGLRDPRAPGARIGILRAEVERDHRHPGAARAPCCLRQLQGRAGHDPASRVLRPAHRSSARGRASPVDAGRRGGGRSLPQRPRRQTNRRRPPTAGAPWPSARARDHDRPGPGSCARAAGSRPHWGW